MKKIIIAFSLLGVAALVVSSCTKDKGKEVAAERTDMSNTAMVQVHNAIVTTSAATARTFLRIDGNFVNGAGIGYGTSFPSTPSSFNITPGFRAFYIYDTLATSTQAPISFAEDMQAGANYTIFLYDSANTAKQKTVVNNIVVPNDTTARLRFANFIYNSGSTVGQGFDIYSVKRNAVIFSNVQETQVTDFIPYASALTDTFYIRLNGSSSNLQNYDTAGKPWLSNVQAVLTPTRLRSYTLIFRGGYRNINNRAGTSPYGILTNARQLGVFTNY